MSDTFQKKLALVTAHQFTAAEAETAAEGPTPIEEWCNGVIHGVRFPAANRTLAVRTQAGEMEASTGDWIVRESDGTFQVWAPARFAEAFDPVESPNAAYQGPEAVIVIRDSTTPGQVEVAGLIKPAVFDPTSAAHLISNFLATKFDDIVELADAYYLGLAAGDGSQPAPGDEKPPGILTDERERTLITPPVLSLSVGA